MKTQKPKPKKISTKSKILPKQKDASVRLTTAPPKIQLITPFLWFDKKAKEAAMFYCSIFPNSKITKIT